MKKNNLQKIIEGVFKQCLGIKTRNNSIPILIIYDNYGRTLAEDFSEYCSNNNLNVILCYYSYNFQQKITNNVKVLERLYPLIENSEVIISLLNSSTKCQDFRINIIMKAKENNLKIVHAPGANKDIFELGFLNLNYKKLFNKCVRIANKLSEGKNIIVITKSKNNKIHKLEIDIENRNAHICAGKVAKGEITNLPTGEAYIAPNENVVSGSIVINGSGPDATLINQKEEIILYFEKGKINLTKSIFSSSVRSRALKKKITDCIKKEPVEYQLGEFGIGLNDSIKQLTGYGILDEKMDGTAHIAIGHNLAFGGILNSKYHHDLIFIPEKILVDNKKLKLNLFSKY